MTLSLNSAVAQRGTMKQRSSRDRKAGSRASLASRGSGSMSNGITANVAVRDETSNDIVWEQMFDELKAIKEQTGTCNLPDKKGRLAKWVYTQRKAFRRLQFSRGTATTRAHLEKLESIGFEFSSSSYVAWDIMFEKYKNRSTMDLTGDEGRKLKLWIANQRLEYSRQRRGLPNNITPERIAKLEALGFEWVGRSGKPKSSTKLENDGNNRSVCSNEEGDPERMRTKATNKRKRLEKSHTTPSKRNKVRTETHPTIGGNDEDGQSRLRDVLNERDHRMEEAGSALQVLAAMKHVGTTRNDSDVAKSFKERGTLPTKEYFHGDTDGYSYAPVSDSTCSESDKSYTANVCDRENKGLPRPASNDTSSSSKTREAVVTVPSLETETSPTAPVINHRSNSSGRFFPDPKVSTVVDWGRDANKPGVEKGRGVHNGKEWPSTASFNSACFGNPYMPCFVGDSVPHAYLSTVSSSASSDSLPHGLTNNPNALLRMPGTTISSVTSTGGMFVTTYLPPVAALQEQLRQQQSTGGAPSSFSSHHDYFANLQVLDGGGHSGLPPALYDALLSRHPYYATLARGGTTEGPDMGDLYYPSGAHNIEDR